MTKYEGEGLLDLHSEGREDRRPRVRVPARIASPKSHPSTGFPVQIRPSTCSFSQILVFTKWLNLREKSSSTSIPNHPRVRVPALIASFKNRPSTEFLVHLLDFPSIYWISSPSAGFSVHPLDFPYKSVHLHLPKSWYFGNDESTKWLNLSENSSSTSIPNDERIVARA